MCRCISNIHVFLSILIYYIVHVIYQQLIFNSLTSLSDTLRGRNTCDHFGLQAAHHMAGTWRHCGGTWGMWRTWVSAGLQAGTDAQWSRSPMHVRGRQQCAGPTGLQLVAASVECKGVGITHWQREVSGAAQAAAAVAVHAAGAAASARELGV